MGDPTLIKALSVVSVVCLGICYLRRSESVCANLLFGIYGQLAIHTWLGVCSVYKLFGKSIILIYKNWMDDLHAGLVMDCSRAASWFWGEGLTALV